MSRKTVLVTGSSRGLGQNLALTFASKGYNVILHGRDVERLNSIKQKICDYKVDCNVVVGDITQKKTIDALVSCSEKEQLDILVNNAGVYLNKSVDEMSPREFKRILEVNLVAPVILTKGVFRVFKKKSSGLIININSVAGKSYGALESAYCTSKHGLKGFMGAFQFEALKYNVPIINVYSGAMQTDMTMARGGIEKFIKTKEVAECIYALSQNYSSMRVNEIEILRKILHKQ